MTTPLVAEGRRSPRWSFWSRLSLATRAGDVYLFRLRIIQTPWFGIFLHDIVSPDPDPDPHDHPWNFLSVVLRGGYEECVFSTETDKVIRRWGLFSVHRMPAAGKAHYISAVKKRTKTLIFVGARKRNWGFWTMEGWVPWNEYEGQPQAKQVVS